jgi:hypothetical protein
VRARIGHAAFLLCLASGAARAQGTAPPTGTGAAPDVGCQAPGAGTNPPSNCEPAPVETPDAPDLGFRKTPNAPAAEVLGLAPTTIERPTTPRGAAVALATGFGSATGINPLDNFAVEVTPYWLFPRPAVTAEALMNSGIEAIWRNASLSMAVVRLPAMTGSATAPTTTTDTRAALGARTTLWPGRPSAAAMSCQKYLQSYLDGVVARLSAARVAFLQDWEKANPQPKVGAGPGPDPAKLTDDAALEKAIQDWKAGIDPARLAALKAWRRASNQALAIYLAAHPEATRAPDDPMVDTCLDRVHDRRGLMADVALAALATIPGGDLAKVSSSGSYQFEGWLTGGWVSGTYLMGESVPTSLSILASVRGQRLVSEPGGVGVTLGDAGVRGIFAWSRFGVSVEGDYRRQWGQGLDPNLWRAVIGFDVRLRDTAWLNVTAGKDFGLSSAQKPLLALANVQWSFGRERSIHSDSGVSE